MKIALDLRKSKNPGIGRYRKALTEPRLAQSPEPLLVLPPVASEMMARGVAAQEAVCA
jgi:hypothetical protein